MSFVEAAKQVDLMPLESDDKVGNGSEEKIESLPLSDWIADFLAHDEEKHAARLIGRVMELHLSEGLKLATQFRSRFSNDFAPDESSYLPNLLRFSSAIPRHPDFFKSIQSSLVNGLAQADFPNENVRTSTEAFLQLLDEQLPQKLADTQSQKKQLTATHRERLRNEFAQTPRSDILEQYLSQIDHHYADMILPNIVFPLPPDHKRDKWQEKVLDTVEMLLDKKILLDVGNDDELSVFGDEVRVRNAFQKIEAKFGEDWYEQYMAELEKKSQKKEITGSEREAQKGRELLHTYNIFERLPADAKNIEPFSCCLRGIVMSYELAGERYFWIDGQSFALDSISAYALTNMVVTQEHITIVGTKNGKEVVLIDGQQYEYIDTCKSLVDQEHILTYFKTSTPEGKKFYFYIDGKKTDFECIDLTLFNSFESYDGGFIFSFKNTSNTTGKPSLKGFIVKVDGSIENTFDLPANWDATQNISIQGIPYFLFHNKRSNGEMLLQPALGGSPIYPNLNKMRFKEANHDDTFTFFNIGPETILACSALHDEMEYYLIHTLPNDKYSISNVIDSEQHLMVEYESGGIEDGDTLIFTPASLHFGLEKSPLGERDKVTIIPQKNIQDTIATDLPLAVNYSPNPVIMTSEFPYTNPTYFYDLKNRKDKLGFSWAYKFLFICVSPEGDLYNLQREPGSGTTFIDYFYKNEKLITATIQEFMRVLDTVNGVPLVLAIEVTKNDIYIPHFYYGDKKVDLQSQDEQLIWPDFHNNHTLMDYDSSFFATYNPTTGLVKELAPRHGVALEKQIFSNTVQQYFKLMIKAQEYLRLLKQYQESQKSKSSSASKMRKKVEAEKEELQKLIVAITGPKEAFAIKPYEREALRAFFNENPEELVEAMNVGLDSSDTFAQEILKTFFPDVWRYEQENKVAKATYLSDTNTSEGVNQESRAVSGGDMVLHNMETDLFGGDAESQFFFGLPKGTVFNAQPSGVLNTLLMQTGRSWLSIDMPSLVGKQVDSEWSTLYSMFLYPEKKGNEYDYIVDAEGLLTYRLLLQPDAVINPQSVRAMNSNGEVFIVEPGEYNGYPVVKVPPDTVEIQYEDIKIIVELQDVGWKSYAAFVERIKEKDLELYEGLSTKLPIDPRVRLKLDQYKRLKPLAAISQAEQLCRTNLYDMNNAETHQARQGLSAHEMLLFARERADVLALRNAENTELDFNEIVYAGVCAESGALLVAMLRKMGFLAGYRREYRPKSSGEFSNNDSHGSAFLLWPANTPEGYQVLYLDGTFSKTLSVLKKPPTPHKSLAERLASGEVTLAEDENLELDDVDEYAKAGLGTKDALQSTLEEKYLGKDKRVAFEVQNAWEKELMGILGELSLLEVSRLYNTLLELRYGPEIKISVVGQEEFSVSESFNTAVNSKERWQVLFQYYEELRSKRRNAKHYWNGAIFIPETDLKTTIEKVITELRK